MVGPAGSGRAAGAAPGLREIRGLTTFLGARG